MSDIFNQVFLVTFVAASIRMAIPILLAALGEIFAERSGVLNINLEGQMLVGAFSGFIVAYFTESLLLGTLAGIVSGIVLALILSYICISLHASQIVAGITLNIFALGITSFWYRVAFGVTTSPPGIETYGVIPIPLLRKIPLLGSILFEQNLLVYLSVIITIIAYIILFKTSLGLRIRATGEYPRAAETMGVNIVRIRYLSVVVCGALAGLGGTFLSLGLLGRFVDNISAGRGFISLAIVIFGKWNPILAFGAAILFGAADALQLRLQALGMQLPYQFMLMLPYALTILTIILTGKNSVAPAAIGIPYEREKL